MRFNQAAGPGPGLNLAHEGYGLHSCGLCSYGLYRCGLCSYGLYGYGLYAYGLRLGPVLARTLASPKVRSQSGAVGHSPVELIVISRMRSVVTVAPFDLAASARLGAAKAPSGRGHTKYYVVHNPNLEPLSRR